MSSEIEKKEEFFFRYSQIIGLILVEVFSIFSFSLSLSLSHSHGDRLQDRTPTTPQHTPILRLQLTSDSVFWDDSSSPFFASLADYIENSHKSQGFETISGHLAMVRVKITTHRLFLGQVPYVWFYIDLYTIN